MTCIGYLYGPIWGGLLEMISDILSFTILGSARFVIVSFVNCIFRGIY